MSPDIALAVRRELVALVMRQMPFALAGQSAAAAVLVAVLWGGFPAGAMLAWLAAWGLAFMATEALRRAHASNSAQRTVEEWEKRLLITAVVRALVWAGATLLLFPPGYADRLYFVGIIIALVSASPNSLAGQPRALTAYITIVLAPLASRFFIDPERTPALFALGIALLVMLAIFVGIGRRFGAGLATATRLRFENEALAEDLRRQKALTDAALERAATASAQKTRFLAAASHDLRQPVHAIGLMLSALSAEALPADAKNMVERLSTSVRGLDGLFASLLDISRLDAGRVAVRAMPVEVQPLMATLEARHAPAAQARGLEFRVRSVVATVRADPGLLEAMLSNLLSNAVKYTDRGGVLFAARIAGGSLRFEVWDTGRGIPDESLGLIFEEFVQLENPERDRNKGLGLGLAVCRRLADLTGHALSVTSRTGQGSVFRLAAPLTRELPAAPATPAAGAPLAGALVLVIDDDMEVRDATKSLLEAAGVWVLIAAGGEQARAAIESAVRYPDAVICDYRLPGGEDGVTLCRALAARIAQPVGLIVATGDDAPASVTDMQVLIKPVAPQALLAALGRAIAPATGA
ncbi:MAG: ATP-binding protein [Burkholderiales bacterium]